MIHTLKLTKACIADCSHQGDCSAGVEHWASQPRIAKQLNAIPTDDIKAFLRRGGWDDEDLQCSDDIELHEKLLWIACCDLREEKPLRCTWYMSY